MLCSISSSTNTGKSSSNWLHRLRSSKGFPSSTDIDLDQFLTHTHHSTLSNSNQPQPNRSTDDPAQTLQTEDPNGDGHMLSSITSNVLSELFIMGDPNHLPDSRGTKCSRKQQNPRLFVALNSSDSDNNNASASNENAARKNESASPMSDDNSGVGGPTTDGDPQVKLVVENVNYAEEEEERDKGSLNLSGFSRTEVTVIDTSFATWKFEKMLFRKKNVWKVRAKKGKSLNLGKKKRKASVIDDHNGRQVEEKKKKILHGQCSSSIKKGNGGAFSEENGQSNKFEAACKKTSDTVGKAPKKKQSTLNLEHGSSSVILIKSIPTSKKSAASFARSALKSTQRHPKV